MLCRVPYALRYWHFWVCFSDRKRAGPGPGRAGSVPARLCVFIFLWSDFFGIYLVYMVVGMMSWGNTQITEPPMYKISVKFCKISSARE